MLFSNQFTNTTRLAILMLWFSGVAQIVVKTAVVFQMGREQTIHAAVQLAENPHQKFFADLNEVSIVSKIERLIKGPKSCLIYHVSPS